MPRITTAHAAPNDTATDAQDMIFIVPRREDRLLIGGLVQPGQWGTTLDPGDGPVRDMLNRAVEFLPSLRHSRLDETDLLRVGLRPFPCWRGAIGCREPGTRIVHNYGHGGADVTLSWGCASEAADLTATALATQAAA